MIKQSLNEVKSKDTLISIPAQMYSKYVVDHAKRSLGNWVVIMKFNIKEGIEYVIENDICILGYQTKEDITMVFNVLRNTKRVKLTTNVISGIYTLDGIPLQKGDEILLTKGIETELYCIYNTSDW